MNLLTHFLTPLWMIVFAYCWWGASPIYWHELAHLAPLFVLANRVVWSRIVLQFIPVSGGTDAKPPRFSLAIVTAFLIGANWGLYIYAILIGETVQASLGYFLLPLMSVAAGALLYRERLSPTDWFAIMLAGVGVAVVAAGSDGFPFIALGLALSMVIYSAIYKSSPAHPLLALRAESTVLMPIALVFIAAAWDDLYQSIDLTTLILLVLAGPVTVLPQLLYVNALREITFTSVGFLQFLVPIVKLLVAVTVLGEVLSGADVVSFSLIFVAVAIYSIGRHLFLPLPRLAAVKSRKEGLNYSNSC